jgi:hypothetical protein
MTMRTTATSDAKRAEHPAKAEPLPRARPPAPKADVERFREAFAAAERRPVDARPRQEDDAMLASASLRKHESRFDSESAETLAIAQAGRLAEIAPGIAAAAAHAPAETSASNELADLIEKHVRRMLVSDDAAHGGREARVMLRIGDGVLAGADLVLTRGERGWLLHADVGNERQAEAMRESAPDLARRFAASGLGAISIDTESR